ncbi:hypothetical protein, partial [Gilvimarinus sp. 1_MG-2023]|uniref:hypothetical protein n=1 Tax=Gilvimarinus sp. 1_MG-2023 TaxID=3062638 RepID=UPI0026E21B0B
AIMGKVSLNRARVSRLTNDMGQVALNRSKRNGQDRGIFPEYGGFARLLAYLRIRESNHSLPAFVPGRAAASERCAVEVD